MWRSAALIGATLALASWIALCLVAQPTRIEDALRLETERVLAEASLGDVRVAVSGRDARLEGLVTSDAVSAEAHRLVAVVAGIRAVDNLLMVREVAGAAEVPATYLEIDVLPDGVSLRGAVPTEALRREVMERAKLVFGADRVDQQLTVDATVASGAAMASAAAVISALAGVGEGTRALLSGDSLRLSGTVASIETRRRIEQRVRAAVPGVRLFFSALAVSTGRTGEREAGGS